MYLQTFFNVIIHNNFNRISGVMVSVSFSNAVDHGFEARSGKTQDYKIGICCFSAKLAAFWKTSKDWLAQNLDNVSKWSDMSIRGIVVSVSVLV